METLKLILVICLWVGYMIAAFIFYKKFLNGKPVEKKPKNIEVGCPCIFPCNEHCYNLMEDNKRLPSGQVFINKNQK